MNFVKENVNQVPIVDTVFAIVEKAKEAKKKYGAENVVDATIGCLYGEDESIVAMDVVFDSLKNQDNATLARYAASFTGNPDFKEMVKDWVLDGNSSLEKEVIATPGGTGAVNMTLTECLKEGETVILPEVAWGSYKLMAQMHNLNVENYSLFDGNHFNMTSFKKACQKVMETQNRLVMVINDPCHNPTGYSLLKEEWQEIIDFLNECSKTHSIVLLNDIAYIDFAFGQKQAKEYFSLFDQFSENVVVVVAFSLSKSMSFYGMRCGAAIILSKTEEAVHQVKIVFEKAARATWSNINNGAMATFVDVLKNHLDEYDAERNKYVALLKERSEIFVQEAKAAGLEHYPYREGFFVTLNMENDVRDAYHEALMDENIFTVKVNKGIRVGLCSLSVEKTKGLAQRMKDIYEEVRSHLS